jgi:hypothetical protein
MRSFLNDTVFTQLPIELQTAIKNVNKISDSGYQGENLITTQDKLWLFSMEELGFEAVQTLSGQGSMYEYFATAENRIAKAANGDAKAYWTRSARMDHASQYKQVNTNGNVSNLTCTTNRSFIFGFSI